MAIAIFERWGLSPREQRMASFALVVLAVFVVLLVPVGLHLLVSSRTADNDELRDTLQKVNSARGAIRERNDKKASISQRYARRAPQLAGFIEQHASAQKLQVTDSVDRPDTPHGKRYNERSTVVHLKKSGMAAIAKFMEEIEKSGYPVDISRLDVRKRAGEADSYDVEIGISAYDRTETTPPPAPASSGKTP